MLRILRFLPVLAAVALSGVALGQVNVIPGTSVKLAKMDAIDSKGHLGQFPNGVSGLAMATTACNIGSVKVPWEAPMKEDHAMISFLIARESNGRFEQISDYSYVKHGFFALTSSFCNSCTEPSSGGGDVLGIGCSDTYKTANNGDMFYLAPAGEIDPWLGTWAADCSYFDLGLGPAPNCDGKRSLSSGQVTSLGPVGTRVNVLDADLDVPGADFFYQGFYTIRGEPQGLRRDNMGSRRFMPAWGGNEWQTPSGQNSFVGGPVLSRWTGTKLTNVGNGTDDGVIYGAVKVTGPVDGIYHYEYALQNRDNNRGVDSFSLPLCNGARIFNAGFRDVDGNAVTDWTATQGSNDLTWSGPGNALRWNSIYNFWFDTDAAPVDGFAMLGQADPGPGLATLSLPIQTPEGLFNVYLGAGCANGAAPELFANGQATIGNAAFSLGSTGNQAGAGQLLFVSPVNGTLDLGSECTMYLGGIFGVDVIQAASGSSDGFGAVTHAMPVPAMPALEGLSVNFQAIGFNVGGGPFSGFFEVTNGLRVHLGSALPSCP